MMRTVHERQLAEIARRRWVYQAVIASAMSAASQGFAPTGLLFLRRIVPDLSALGLLDEDYVAHLPNTRKSSDRRPSRLSQVFSVGFVVGRSR